MTRDQFETFVSLPPRNRGVYRWDNDDSIPERRGAYVDYVTQIAWEVLQEAERLTREEQKPPYFIESIKFEVL